MTSKAAPRTAAGRALLAAFGTKDRTGEGQPSYLRAVLAIETEASGPAAGLDPELVADVLNTTFGSVSFTKHDGARFAAEYARLRAARTSK